MLCFCLYIIVLFYFGLNESIHNHNVFVPQNFSVLFLGILLSCNSMSFDRYSHILLPTTIISHLGFYNTTTLH